MTVLSNLITFTCFPSIIIYKELPNWLIPSISNDDTQTFYWDTVLIWMNCVNLAIFFSSMTFGIFISGCCLRERKVLHW